MKEQRIDINGMPLSTWQARMVNDWTVQRDSITKTYIQPQGRQSILPCATEIALKKISFTLDFSIPSLRPLLEMELLKPLVEIYGPDGVYYTCVLQELGAEDTATDPSLVSVPYTLIGYPHGYRIQIPDGRTEFRCFSEIETDCILRCTAPASGTCTFAGVSFSNVSRGDELTIDGESKLVQKNGENCLLDTDIVEFPTLNPGKINQISGPAAVSVSYIPIYL